MDSYSMNVGSSTPDGLAPLSQTGVTIFVCVLTSLPLLWAGLNFFLLITKPLP